MLLGNAGPMDAVSTVRGELARGRLPAEGFRSEGNQEGFFSLRTTCCNSENLCTHLAGGLQAFSKNISSSGVGPVSSGSDCSGRLRATSYELRADKGEGLGLSAKWVAADWYCGRGFSLDGCPRMALPTLMPPTSGLPSRRSALVARRSKWRQIAQSGRICRPNGAKSPPDPEF